MKENKRSKIYIVQECSSSVLALAIKNSINDENMLEKAKLLYEGNTSVVEFNRNNLYYKALL